MEFLDEIFLDNTVRSYLIAVAVVLLGFLFKHSLSHRLASLIHIPIRSNWKTVTKEEFKALIVKPLSWFLAVTVTILAIGRLNFPHQFYFEIYNISTADVVRKIGICILVIYLIWFILSLVSFIAVIFEHKAKTTNDKADDQLIVFFRDFLKALIVIFGVLIALKFAFNQNIGTILTGLSIVGAALALAAKESLENLIASFVIFFDKPFFTGDTLKVNNVTGTVEHIGLRSTRIRTPDKTLVTMPNKQMVDGVVDNISMRSQMRSEIKLDFAASTSTAALEALMQKVRDLLARKTALVSSYSVFFSEFTKNGATLTIEYFTIPCSMQEFNQLKQDVNLALKAYVEELKMHLAVAVSEINIVNPDQNAGAVKSQPII